MRVLRFVLLLVAFPAGVFCQATDTSKLTGRVYEAQGSVIVGAKVMAIGADGKKFQAVTNDMGSYVLALPFNRYDRTAKFREAKYDVIVEHLGFQRFQVKGYVFIPSQFGKMNLDIGLEIGRSSDQP